MFLLSWLDILYIIIAILILRAIVKYYNKLVGARNGVKNAWAQIDVQLNRRADLIPNLLETVKAYASHEKTVFEEVTEARSQMMSATTVKDSADANFALNNSLRSLFAIAENYPELKANENFQDLQDQLRDTEDKIAYSRQVYNNTVLMYDNKCEMFPTNILAKLFNFREAEFFETSENNRKIPKIQF